ncbi:MAG TPA: acetyl-CoA acetyltransferase [Actinomycetota bacterium]
MKNDVFIVGAAETPLGEVKDHSEFSMLALAADEALGEAGLSLSDVDGLLVNYMGEQGTVQVSEYLGIAPRYCDSTDLGGAAFEAFVHHAQLALQAGECDVALIGFASRQRSKRQRSSLPPPIDSSSLTAQFQTPAGLPLPIGHYALIAARHMHEYGTTREQLAHVAVAAREWAIRNPKAWAREPLTVDDVLASRPICEPLHRLDCCLVTDGGGAIVLTRGDRAEDATKPAVRILGAAEAVSHWHITELDDLTTSPGAASARRAFERAGIGPQDVDVLQPYDSFTITVLIALEDLGFCKKGEGGPFVAEGVLAPGGELPSMTSGGGLSYNHPGALGVQLLIESVRQLRGEAEDRQVPDAQIAVAHGVGGMMSTASTVVLSR